MERGSEIEFEDQFSYTRGSHALKAGGEIEFNRWKQANFAGFGGTFTFAGDFERDASGAIITGPDGATTPISSLEHYRRTLAGIDKLDNYIVGGKTYSPLDYLRFINPGDLRVVTTGRGCGQCHAPHANSVANSVLATSTGILSAAMYGIGVANQVPASQGLYVNTAADLGFRAVQDVGFAPTEVGLVSELYEYPVMSQFGVTGPGQLFNNNDYLAAALSAGQNPDNTVITGSPLADL